MSLSLLCLGCRCIEEGRLLEADQFVVVGKTAAEEFSTGKIVGELGREGRRGEGAVQGVLEKRDSMCGEIILFFGENRLSLLIVNNVQWVHIYMYMYM